MGRKPNSLVDNETIYKLKEQGLSYKSIRKYFLDQGIEVSEKTIVERCAIIYAEKKKKIPSARRKKSKERKNLFSTDMLKYLKSKGMTDKEVSRYFLKQGVRISSAMVKKLYKRIEEERIRIR